MGAKRRAGWEEARSIGGVRCAAQQQVSKARPIAHGRSNESSARLKASGTAVKRARSERVLHGSYLYLKCA